MSVWFITGASRGFGRLLARAVLDHGDQVVATARDPQAVHASLAPTDALLVVPLDVTDEGQARQAVDAAVARFGRIDVLVNNAGYGLFGAVEEVTDGEARALFDTNVFGVLNVSRAALPTMRAQGSGRVLNISSSAAIASSVGRGLYSATKCAVEGLSEAMHAELAPFGVRVTIVEPGSFRTDFLSSESRRGPSRSIDAYADTVGAFQQAVSGLAGRQPGDPAKAVAALIELASVAEPPLRLPLGSDSLSLWEDTQRSVAEELGAWRHLSLSTDF